MFLFTSLLIAQSCFLEMNGQTVELEICQGPSESIPNRTSVSPSSSFPNQETLQVQNHDDILISQEKVEGFVFILIQGVYQKETPGACRVAGVEYEIYDQNRNLIERYSDQIDNLPPQTGWSFEVVTLVERQQYGSHRLSKKYCLPD